MHSALAAPVLLGAGATREEEEEETEETEAPAGATITGVDVDSEDGRFEERGEPSWEDLALYLQLHEIFIFSGQSLHS